MARHFQCEVEVFFKEIILDDLLGKAQFYAFCIEFKERGSPHVRSFIWIFNAPNIENEAAYIQFIEKTINAQLLDHLNDPELFELVKTYQVKSYIDNDLYPAKVNVIDPTKDNFTQPLSVKEILDELQVSKDDYYRALPISKDGDSELHLKRKPNSCFGNNYFDAAVKVW